MKVSKLKFKNLTLWCNPQTFSITATRSLFRRTAPGLGEIVGENSVLARTVRGEGEFFGEGAFEQYSRFYQEFLRAGEGLLQLPGLSPFPAYFTALSLTGQAGQDSLSYTFEFREKPRLSAESEAESPPEYYTVQSGDTLWEIAARYGMSLEQLCSLNTQTDNLSEGSKVRLR